MSGLDPRGLLCTRCNLQVIVNQARKKLPVNKLHDFTLWSVSLVFKAILVWASIRRGAFIRGERLIQSLHLRGAFIGYKAFI